jgi:hypothetical protein
VALYVSWVIVLELHGLSPVPASPVGTMWGSLFCWQGMVDMFLLSGTFRHAVDGAIMFLMGRPVAFPMARLVMFPVDRLGCFLFLLVLPDQVEEALLLDGAWWICSCWGARSGASWTVMVTSHMARLPTFSVGGLGVFLGADVVDMFLLGGMFWCAVDGAIMSFMGGLVAYHIRACQFGQ